jgi:DNA-binding NtrC family response regulator
LLIADQSSVARACAEALEKINFDTRTAQDTADIAAAMGAAPAPQLALIDIKRMDDAALDVIDLVRRHTGHGRMMPVIVMTDHGSLNLAVEAMRRGASDFLVRPFGPDRLITAVQAAWALAADDQPRSLDPGLAGSAPPAPNNRTIMAAARPVTPDFGGFIGLSPVMQDLYEKIEQVAHSNAPVFITGESGTGKEVCAEAIHRHSRRGDKPFVPLNCAAIPRDLIESELFGHVKGAFTGAIADRDGAAMLADGGTLFLDEIAEMPVDMQTKLLRFLQNQTFMKVGGSKLEKADVRIICATNRDPLAETRVGRFREDLYYRLHVLPLHMPPLRDRGEDVIDIAEVLVRRYNEEEGKRFHGISDDAAMILRSYAWPGNIRQLQNVIRNIIVMHDGDMVLRRMLPGALQQNARSAEQSSAARPIRPLAEVERETIESAIAACGGNIPRAAVMLGISPSTIYRKKMGWDENDATVTG